MGHVLSNGWTFYDSGGERHKAGVGSLLRRDVASGVIGCWQVTSRVILIKITALTVCLKMIQLYALTSDYSDSAVEQIFVNRRIE